MPLCSEKVILHRETPPENLKCVDSEPPPDPRDVIGVHGDFEAIVQNGFSKLLVS